MDRDKIDGKATVAKGSLKEAFGKLTGNDKMRAEGIAEKAAGKTQSTAGGVKDKVRGMFRR